jgi:hypothetical protein
LRSRFFLENKIRDIRTKKKLPPDLGLSHNELKERSAISRQSISAGHVKKPNLPTLRPVEHTDRFGGGLQ